jgi:hypothetical protein
MARICDLILTQTRSGDMPSVVYVPFLKGRQGEFAALADIQLSTRQRVLPLIEIVPGPADEPVDVRSVINHTAKKLKVWAGDRVLLDAGLLPTDVVIAGESGAAGYAVQAAAGELVNATPVIRLNDEDLALQDAAAAHAEHGHGIAIRLNVEDLDEDAEDIDKRLLWSLAKLGVSRAEVDLLLDMSVVDGDPAVRVLSRLAADALRGLTAIDEWRQVVVASGAFPADLSTFGPWTIGEAIRYDAALYDRLRQRKRIDRMPIFGDYAIAHPLLANGPAFPPAPQLRYTVADKWLTLKGSRNDPRGHEQFYEVCARIARHPEFVGPSLGRADARIADPTRYGPGNGATWRQIGTTHHLDYVVQRLTSLDEP